MKTDGTCYLCRRRGVTEDHHVLHGTANRKVAERLGLKKDLCPDCHRGTKGVHGRDGAEANRKLKVLAQTEFELTRSRDEWMVLVGRNYL